MAPRISPRGFPPNLLRVNPLAALVVVPEAMREDSAEMTRFSKVAETVKRTLRRQEREEINRAEYRAHKDVLLKEQALDRQMRWNRVRVGIETPYPLDSETATAMEAARQHYVLTWEILEERDDIGQWLIDSFLAKGKTALPDGASGLISETKFLYLKVPTEAEVRELSENAEKLQKFLTGEDCCYGLADVPDSEYDEHYEAIVQGIKGLVQPGTGIDLPTAPHAFLREASLVDGGWIDSYAVELPEARSVEKEFLLEESDDSHPMAWYRIIDEEGGSKVDAAVTTKLRQQTKKHLAGFPGCTRVIDERQCLSFADYLKWRGRRNKGDLKSGVRMGRSNRDRQE